MTNENKKSHTSPLLLLTNGITKMNKAVGSFLSLSMVALTLIILLEVFLRYVLRKPTVWGYDVSLWLYGMPAVLGGGYVLAEKGHVNMDMIYSKVPKRGRAILDVITSVLFFAFVGVLTWQGLKFGKSAFVNNEMSITTFQIRIWPLKAMIPVAAILLILQGLAKFIQDLYLAITGRELE